MKKKLIKELRPFWMSYLLLLVLTMLRYLIQNGSDLVWPYSVFFYVPFVFCGIYLYGLFIGIWMQRKYKFNRKKIILLSVIFLLLSILLLLPPGLDGILKNGIFGNTSGFKSCLVYPSIGSTLLFTVGSLVTIRVQNLRLKSNNTESRNEEEA